MKSGPTPKREEVEAARKQAILDERSKFRPLSNDERLARYAAAFTKQKGA